jgi:fucose 4-O-acetylase-like acetyltransferase
MAEHKENRNQTVDILRGIAMLLVVLGHTLSGCTVNSESSFLYNIIWTLQMPLFILISGYVTKYSRPVNSRRGILIYMGKKTLAYLLPWAVWTFLVRGVIYEQKYFLNLKHIFFNMDSGYWFLFTLWCIVIIFGLSQFISQYFCTRENQYAKFVAHIIAYVFGMAILAVIGIVVGMSFLCIKLTLYYMPFYFAGFLYGQIDGNLSNTKLWNNVKEISVAFSFVLWIFLMNRFNFFALSEGIINIAIRAIGSLTVFVKLVVA